jgi:hypothetical protein
MKKLIILLCLFLPILAIGQNPYSIFSCTEEVKMFDESTKSWRPVKKGTKIDAGTLLIAPNKESVQILDDRTNRIYTNIHCGKVTVGSILDKSSKAANSILTNLNKQIAKNITKQKGSGYSTYGVTTRGLKETLDFADSLYYAIYSNIKNPSPSECKKIEKVKHENNIISFIIKNESDDPIYVSIVYGNMDQMQVCLTESMFEGGAVKIPAQTSLDLSAYKFVDQEEDKQYYLVSSNESFSLIPISNNLKYMRAPRFEAEQNLVEITPAH